MSSASAAMAGTTAGSLTAKIPAAVQPASAAMADSPLAQNLSRVMSMSRKRAKQQQGGVNGVHARLERYPCKDSR